MRWGANGRLQSQIVTQGGHYILAVKDNQPDLAEDIAECFAAAGDVDYEEVVHDRDDHQSKGHGRRERRQHTVITDPAHLAWLPAEQHWPHLAALGRVEAERHFADGRSEQETRYDVLSQPLSAVAFGAAVRSHWGIENQVHWVLDVTFGADHSRKRAGNAAHNFGLLLRFALNLLRQTPGKPGMSRKAKRLRAAWDTSYLLTILAAFKMR